MPAANRQYRRWMLYALGGGIGHLTRAIALARAAIGRPGFENEQSPQTQICLLTNSPFAEGLRLADELGARDSSARKSGASEVDVRHRIVTLSPDFNREETATRVVDILQATPFDVLVVDTFPRGLAGELAAILPGLACPKVLVHRDLNPRYIAQFGLATVINQFDRLLVPGESAPFESSSQALRTAPWLIRDDHELLPPTDARRLLNVESDTAPVVAVIGCGRAEEADQMRRLAVQLANEFATVATVRFVTLHTNRAEVAACQSSPGLTTVNLWPFLEAIRGVSVIVGSGGYNTVHEARATGTRFIGLSWPRLYDRQQRRLRSAERATDVQAVRQHVAAALAPDDKDLQNPPPCYQNGVHQAVEIIKAMYD